MNWKSSNKSQAEVTAGDVTEIEIITGMEMEVDATVEVVQKVRRPHGIDTRAINRQVMEEYRVMTMEDAINREVLFQGMVAKDGAAGIRGAQTQVEEIVLDLEGDTDKLDYLLRLKKYRESVIFSVIDQLSTSSCNSMSDSDLLPIPSNSPIKIKGYKDERLQIIFNMPKLSKLLSVTPSCLVSKAPTSVPTVDAPLKMLIKVAKSTASTPGGQILAARTRMGKKANSPRTARTTSSPNTKASSGMPSERFAWEISSN